MGELIRSPQPFARKSRIIGASMDTRVCASAVVVSAGGSAPRARRSPTAGRSRRRAPSARRRGGRVRCRRRGRDRGCRPRPPRRRAPRPCRLRIAAPTATALSMSSSSTMASKVARPRRAGERVCRRRWSHGCPARTGPWPGRWSRRRRSARPRPGPWPASSRQASCPACCQPNHFAGAAHAALDLVARSSASPCRRTGRADRAGRPRRRRSPPRPGSSRASPRPRCGCARRSCGWPRCPL